MIITYDGGCQCQTVCPLCAFWAKKPSSEPISSQTMWVTTNTLIACDRPNEYCQTTCSSENFYCTFRWTTTIVSQSKQVLVLIQWCKYNVHYQAGTTHITGQLSQNLSHNKSRDADKRVVHKTNKADGKITVVTHNRWSVGEFGWKIFSFFWTIGWGHPIWCHLVMPRYLTQLARLHSGPSDGRR